MYLTANKILQVYQLAQPIKNTEIYILYGKYFVNTKEIICSFLVVRNNKRNLNDLDLTTKFFC